jgi:hypothetical protein
LQAWSEAAYGTKMSGKGGSTGSRDAWARFFSNNKGSQEEAFNVVVDVSAEFDDLHGTNITEYVFRSLVRESFEAF